MHICLHRVFPGILQVIISNGMVVNEHVEVVVDLHMNFARLRALEKDIILLTGVPRLYPLCALLLGMRVGLRHYVWQPSLSWHLHRKGSRASWHCFTTDWEDGSSGVSQTCAWKSCYPRKQGFFGYKHRISYALQSHLCLPASEVKDFTETRVQEILLSRVKKRHVSTLMKWLCLHDASKHVRGIPGFPAFALLLFLVCSSVFACLRSCLCLEAPTQKRAIVAHRVWIYGMAMRNIKNTEHLSAHWLCQFLCLQFHPGWAQLHWHLVDAKSA